MKRWRRINDVKKKRRVTGVCVSGSIPITHSREKRK